MQSVCENQMCSIETRPDQAFISTHRGIQKQYSQKNFDASMSGRLAEALGAGSNDSKFELASPDCFCQICIFNLF